MNIVDIIKEQHKEFRMLMDQVRDTTPEDPEERRRLFQLTRSKLNAHGRAEERVLFPRMEQDERTRQAALESWEWHAASSNLMRSLIQLSPVDELWMPKWLVIRGTILTHLDAEETRALGPLKDVFDQEELERMGRDFLVEEKAVKSARMD
jgi:hypothetical protein